MYFSNVLEDLYKTSNARQEFTPFFPACYLLSAFLQTDREPVLHKAAEAPARWKPFQSEVAQHIWNVSSADPLTKSLLPLEGLAKDAATP